MKPNLVVVGGGFAGAALVKQIQRTLPDGYALLWVSEDSYTTFNPLLPEAVGASIFPEHVVAPLREILHVHAGHRFVMGKVTAVDQTTNTIACTSLVGPMTLPYHQLVLAFGNRARLDLIPGMAEHALPLKTVGDAMEIRNVVLRRLASVELTQDPAERRRLGHFIVIGGGFSGVEVAGELIDCLRSIRRYYPRVGQDELRVTVVQNIDKLLPELPPVLGQAALRSLRKRGVQLLLNVGANQISKQGVLLSTGEWTLAATVICTIGTEANPLATALGLPLERGRIVTQADMRIPGHPNLWAVGDCALVPNANDGQASPPTAQFAVQQAKLLASNLVSHLQDRATRSFNYRARGTMAAIGHMKGVAQVMGVNVTGLPAWLLWRAYYLSQMPTMGRKVRIFIEWSWGMFFPTDITHLRFARSKDQK